MASPHPVTWRTVRRESLSGLAAMLVAVPAAVANGLVLYAPLGAAFTGAGALAGVIGAAALGTVAPLLGGTPGLVSAPSPAAAAFMAVLASQLVAGGLAPAAAVVRLALVLAVAGALQVVAGLARGGRLVKYLPYPVVAGYLTGGGLLILHLQVPRLLGAPQGASALQALLHPARWSGVAMAIAATTLLVTLLAGARVRSVPATLLGLLAGVAAHRLLALRQPDLTELAGNPLLVGLVLPGSGLSAGLGAWVRELRIEALTAALVPGAALAALLSIDTLKTCLLVDAITHGRHDSDRELVGQGLGNLLSSLVGGAPGTGIVSGSMVNVTSGARSRWSGTLAGLLALGVLLALEPAVARLPVPALSAIVALMALRMLQGELVELVRDRATLTDFAVAATVVLVAVSTNLATAAAVGVLLAALLFLHEQTRTPVVRRVLDGRSTTTAARAGRESLLLEQRGAETLVMELQGSLFFGTADRVAAELAPTLAHRRFVILDLARVRSVDLSAVHTLRPIAGRLAARGGRLLLCEPPGGPTGERLRRYLDTLGLTREPAAVLLFPHREDAVEWAEERILGEALPGPAEVPLEQTALFQGLPAPAMAAVRAAGQERRLARGQRLFAAGDLGRELFLIRSGRVKVLGPLDGERTHLLNTLGPGEHLGDLAYLDGAPRSAHADASQDCLLFVLSPLAVARAAAQAPGLEAWIAARLAIANAERLRRATALALRLRRS